MSGVRLGGLVIFFSPLGCTPWQATETRNPQQFTATTEFCHATASGPGSCSGLKQRLNKDTSFFPRDATFLQLDDNLITTKAQSI